MGASLGKGRATLSICFDAFTLGYRFSLTLGDVNIANTQGTNSYRLNVLPADGGIPVAGFSAGLFAMFTVVQDGAAGLKIYRDGVEVTTEVPITMGTGFDQDSWWNTT